MPPAFLTADAILQIVLNVSSGLVVYPKIVETHMNEEVSFMATENILMAATRKGGDRQTLHKDTKEYSIAAGRRDKKEGLDNDLLGRIANDLHIGSVNEDIESLWRRKKLCR